MVCALLCLLFLLFGHSIVCAKQKKEWGLNVFFPLSLLPGGQLALRKAQGRHY